MKKASVLITCLFFAGCCAALTGCEGKAGADGAIGPKGDAGPQGPKGDPGSANVIQLTFGSRTHTGGEIDYALTGITQEQLGQSAYFTYVKSSNNYWYSLPGTTVGGTREYRTYVTAAASVTPRLYINRIAGTGSETFSTTRVIVIPAGVLSNARRALPDFADYEAVKKYYNLSD